MKGVLSLRFALETALDLSMSLRRPHRLLSAAHQTADRLAGIAETFVLANCKGDRKRDRELRRRGGVVGKRGLSRVPALLPAASRQGGKAREPVPAPNVLPVSDANRCCPPDVASLTNASMLRPANGTGSGRGAHPDGQQPPSPDQAPLRRQRDIATKMIRGGSSRCTRTSASAQRLPPTARATTCLQFQNRAIGFDLVRSTAFLQVSRDLFPFRFPVSYRLLPDQAANARSSWFPD